MTDEIRWAALDTLLLDSENPRLPESVARDQQSMLDYISETTAIEELMDAIAENDFFPGEPIIVVPSTTELGKFVVVEGNRRLTAVKLLRDPANSSRPGARMREIARLAKHRPDKLPIIERPNRRDVLPYLGFRHITGIKQWEPLAKARYIEQLFNLTDQKAEPKARYGYVASAIGSRRDHIKRNLDALAVFKTIKEAAFYGIEGLDDASLKFSVLSTALADERIGAFSGVTRKNAEENFEAADPIVNPGTLYLKAIEELTRWIFEKDTKGKTRVGESRNLRLLSAVVSNPRALTALRAGSPLKIAYQMTSDMTGDFVELLYQAEAALTEAASMVATVSYEDDAYQVARRILENIKLIGRELKEKHRPDEDEF
ncbi:MAG: ParB N-terminal domain-containing protein [Thiobacillus sp.]